MESAFIEALIDATAEFRKGEEVVEEDKGAVKVTHIYAMPSLADAPPDLAQVDMHFIVVGIDREKAEAMKPELIGWCKNYPEPERLAGGPSYIELGAAVGSQDVALRLMALGQVLDLWKVITPETLGFEGKQADMLAGRGYVMISGWKDA
jgi:hypothetical protein